MTDSSSWTVPDSVAHFHRESLVWDNHICLPQTLDPQWINKGLDRYRSAGVDMLMVNIGDASLGLENRLRICALYRDWIRQNSDRYQLITTADDILAAKAQGKTAVGFNVEGAVGIEGQTSIVPLYYDLGVRWMLLAYNRNNRYAGGCHDEDTGLTQEGYELIAEMDRVGMVKCCSHTGYKSAMDILEATKVPTIFSHSNPRALRDHGRNIPDELIKACAKTGGTLGINGIGLFLGDNDASTEAFVRHVNYVADLVGPEHVAIALDYFYGDPSIEQMAGSIGDNSNFWPPGNGYETAADMAVIEPERFPQLTEALLKERYSDDQVRGILGENLLRVARQVWK